MTISLEQLSFNKYMETFNKMPPVLQENILNDSVDNIKTQVRNETKSQFCNYIPFLVNEIMEDLIQSMTNNRIRTNFYATYPNINKDIIECAIRTAEMTVDIMEQRYIPGVIMCLVLVLRNNKDDHKIVCHYDVGKKRLILGTNEMVTVREHYDNGKVRCDFNGIDVSLHLNMLEKIPEIEENKLIEMKQLMEKMKWIGYLLSFQNLLSQISRILTTFIL